MQLSRASLVSLTVGVAAAALTAFCFAALRANPYRDPFPGVSTVLAFGVFVASIPFGGMHGFSIGETWLIALGSLFNGIFCGGLARAIISFFRGVRRARAYDSSERIT